SPSGGAMEGWPSIGSHASHRNPLGGAPVACGDCHQVPTMITDPVHFATAPIAAVRFSGTAAFARGAMPTYDPVTHTCTNVACHGFGMPGRSDVQPVWGDTSGNARRCGQCHAVPQPLPHTQQTNCESLNCHGGEITPTPTGPQISAFGRSLHQNGVIDVHGVGP
ncbi:MAG: CxxxxCH/CxxCH domain-containing protein, partial [Deltaproteobacteria bacterium]